MAKIEQEYKKTGISKRSDGIGFFWEDHLQIREKKEDAPKRGAPDPIWLDPNWLPEYEKAAAFQPKLLTMQEFLMLPRGTELLYDVECYPNFFCVTFQDFATGANIYFELSPWKQMDYEYLRLVWKTHTKVGFNNKGYDTTMIELCLAGLANHQLKAATDMLILRDEETNQAMRPYEVLKHFGVKKGPKVDEIDLMEVAPLRAKLKIYGGRLHTPYMQDLPFPPGTVLTAHQAVILRYYNFKDIIHTRYLRHALTPQLQLRDRMSIEYSEDLRSRSDAQIAETVMRKELGRMLGRQIKQPAPDVGKQFYFKDPGFLRFQTKLMQDVYSHILRTPFEIAKHGGVVLPKSITDLDVRIGKGVYQMGIGGLHSTEKKTAHVAGGGYRILDRDVTSYYPYLILNQNLFPAHIGPLFLTVYRGIVLQRIEAKANAKREKAAGNTQRETFWNHIAQSLKIVINGAYGKLGSQHSCLYAPEAMIQTTIAGQLSILMLIEAMECVGIQVISANTDGIVMKVHETQEKLYNDVLAWWEGVTKFETEETEYSALYSRDVNSYMAVKPGKNGKPATIKGKGAFANPWNQTDDIESWLHINPGSQICVQAVQDLLTKGTPVEATIRKCKDMSQFVNIRTVAGGCAVVTRGDYANRTPSEQMQKVRDAGGYEAGPGLWRYPDTEGEQAMPLADAYRLAIQPQTLDYLGGGVRWYYAVNREPYEMVTANKGHRVGGSDGAKPCMEMPATIPDDLDYNWYINEADSILKSIAYA